ncbi:MAG: hypothetical protein ACJ8AT_39220 [Hyalangium sp.]|uniref:hypothetical protein n=1 Tax=Hyalangium sp. TaxID=2028555 RepID=UPI00389B24A3
MKIGATGHQHRLGLDWTWAAEALDLVLAEQPAPLIGFSALAAGADQLFARTVLSRGGRHVALIPLKEYERCFDEPDDLTAYRELLSESEIVQLAHPGPTEAAFLAAGRQVVERSDLLVAIWDGQSAVGRGGTADIVAYARESGRPVVHLNPFSKVIRYL